MIESQVKQLSDELSLPSKKITAVLKLLSEGNTIPFISRYRKEMTGNLDEVQVRDIKERSEYLKELEDRRKVILESIIDQNKLSDDLEKKIKECNTKSSLEDIYLPYKPKRRTKATIAKDKGLEPLAKIIMEQPIDQKPEVVAQYYISEKKGVLDTKEALEGARHIVAEWISEEINIRDYLRNTYQNEALLCSKVRKDWKDKETKFKQYYEFSELIKKIPSHRYLAIRRGEKELILSVSLDIEKESLLLKISKILKQNHQSPFSKHFSLAIEDSYKRLLSPSIEIDVSVNLKMKSDREAVKIFEQNLRHLLLSAPMGGKSVVGIDPGLRTGCKCAAVNATGKYLDTVTLYLTSGTQALQKAKHDFLTFVSKHKPVMIAVGNGTGGRETETFVKSLIQEAGLKEINVVQISECGASVYSASEVAREEFPDLDLTIRGAISIARRLQDPLAELVKVEPKALGIGQYQHDVYQTLIEEKLHDVVESCVNKVGVDLNTASASLLSYVVGLGPSLSKKIVKFRNEKGEFTSRKQLLKVPGLGAKGFEQSAGFLRIRKGKNPLDGSAVHPERYELVLQMAKDKNLSVEELVGNGAAVNEIDIQNYLSEEVGKETLLDILEELQKPGLDPRNSFEAPKFRDDVTKVEDLKEGMSLEGIVTNVTAFGAFVDIGVHQDGLIHISELSDRFIKDPNEVVKTGDRLKVRVLTVDLKLKRISLSAKSSDSQIKPKPEKIKSRNQERSKFTNNPFNSL
jgi:protein Tex